VNQRFHNGDGSWRAVSWSWSPLEWGWLPTAGPPPSSGGPSRTVSMRVDTRHAAQDERFDLWRELTAVGLDYEPTDLTPTKGFRGTGFGFFANQDGYFVLSDSDPLAVRRSHRQTLDAGNQIAFGLVIDGERLAQHDGDARTRTRPGEFYVDDGRRRLDLFYPGRQRTLWLSVPRDEVAAIFRGEAPSPSELTAALRASRLAPVIHSQFAAVARYGGQFTDIEGEAAIMAANRMVLAALAATSEDRARGPEDASAILIVARRHVENHLADPNLDVESLAAAVGCSRAALYRAFAEAGSGVAEAIRDLRLERMRALLESEALSVSEAAARCGFGDPRALQRRFKERFGLSPRDLQIRARRL
jgi:AraC family transcriptional activator of tynA and feaB